VLLPAGRTIDAGATDVTLRPCTTPRKTVVPPLGAGLLRVTVPVVEAGARSGPGGVMETERMVMEGGGAVTLTLARWAGLAGNGVTAEIVAEIGGAPSSNPEAVSVKLPLV